MEMDVLYLIYIFASSVIYFNFVADINLCLYLDFCSIVFGNVRTGILDLVYINFRFPVRICKLDM